MRRVNGTSIITWHDGRARYDEVVWDPTPVDEDQAREIALHKLGIDDRATRVHVEYEEHSFVEAVRESPAIR